MVVFTEFPLKGWVGSFATSSSLGPLTEERMGVVGNRRSEATAVRSGGVEDRASVSAVYWPIDRISRNEWVSVLSSLTTWPLLNVVGARFRM